MEVSPLSTYEPEQEGPATEQLHISDQTKEQPKDQTEEHAREHAREQGDGAGETMPLQRPDTPRPDTPPETATAAMPASGHRYRARWEALQQRLRARWRLGVPRDTLAALAALDLGLLLLAGAVWLPLWTGDDGGAIAPDTPPGHVIIVSPSPVEVPGQSGPGGDEQQPPPPAAPMPSSTVEVPDGAGPSPRAPQPSQEVPEPSTPPSPPGGTVPPEPTPSPAPTPAEPTPEPSQPADQ